MKVGEVLVWETDKAAGHSLRKKFHIYICAADAFDGHTFLFISSINYEGDFAIKKADYAFLDHDSFISLGRIVCYTDEELKAYKISSIGQIKPDHLRSLFNAVQGSSTMEGRDIKRVCNVLKQFV
jgi:hypothetical protein